MWNGLETSRNDWLAHSEKWKETNTQVKTHKTVQKN